MEPCVTTVGSWVRHETPFPSVVGFPWIRPRRILEVKSGSPAAWRCSHISAGWLTRNIGLNSRRLSKVTIWYIVLLDISLATWGWISRWIKILELVLFVYHFFRQLFKSSFWHFLLNIVSWNRLNFRGSIRGENHVPQPVFSPRGNFKERFVEGHHQDHFNLKVPGVTVGVWRSWWLMLFFCVYFKKAKHWT